MFVMAFSEYDDAYFSAQQFSRGCAFGIAKRRPSLRRYSGGTPGTVGCVAAALCAEASACGLTKISN